MSVSLLLALSLAAAPPSPVSDAARTLPSAPGDSEYAQGVEALKRKDSGAAVTALSRCAQLVPKRIDCQWELGWAYWLEGEWPKVIEAWESVKRLSPHHPGLEENLAQARSQLELREQLAASVGHPGGAADAAPRAPPPAGAALRIRAVGDMMIGTEFPEGYLPPEDGATLLSDVKEWLSDADLTFANLEGPLCDSGESDKCRPGPSETCYAFRSPTRYGKYYADVGIDFVSTANNHSGDFGEECRRETEKTLDALGIKWSGAPGTVAYLESKGVKVAMIAFHTSMGCNYMHDYATGEAMVRAATQKADVVIVSFHGGAEGAKYQRVPNGKETFHGENRGHLREFTHRMIDAGADLVLGHGPHVLRAMEVYKGRLIAYSLGNFATYGRFNLRGPNGLGAVLEATVDGEGKFLEGRILPTRQIGAGIPVRDPRKEAIGVVRNLSREDFPRTAVQVDDDGRITARGAVSVQKPE